ncbi:MAG: hypothetical protein IPP14_00080 [Planctomycetes bacterium]|nr:hypothetical protein [Planctomycetota bacterium]
MRRYSLVATATLALLALASSLSPVSAEAAEGDFKEGWNTWKIAQKGDWVEYSMDMGNKVKDEVIEIGEDKKIKYAHTMFSKEGKEQSRKEFTKEWNGIRLMGTPSPKAQVTWRDDEHKIGAVTLKCKVAQWTVESKKNEIWYSAGVPCGGIVKQFSDGKDTVWVSSFKSSKASASDTGKAAGTTNMPRFFAKVGNVAIYKVTSSGKADLYLKREVTAVDADESKYTQALCDAEGTVAEGAKVSEQTQTKAKWDQDYATAKEKDVKIKVTAGEYTCEKFVSELAGTTITSWISDGLLVKLTTKKGEAESSMELQKLELQK